MSESKVNLPKTKFSMKANLAQKEPIQQKDWDQQNLYQKILEKNKNNPLFILHDGPPYANGHIHLGQTLNKVLKDIILKYEFMNGKYVPYIPGWDCHGLPIEYKLLKEMQIEKADIDQLKFRKKAAQYAQKYIKIQKQEFKRLGIFGDWENPYLTLNPKYEGSIIRVFGELVKKGYIYRGLKPVYWCASCETALAEAEVEYADHTSTSIYVKFPIDGKICGQGNVSVLIWTTTPWTLPGNVAIAAHPDYEYVIFAVKNSENPNIKTGEKLLIAKDLLEKVCEKIEISDYEILKTIEGKDLEYLKCSSPYREDLSIGILAEYVTTQDGTGIVHIAPGHGEDDYIAGLKYSLPIIAPVDNQGKFLHEVEKYKGQSIFEANPNIVKDLRERGLLLKKEEITHSYPHCWRCKNPVIFRATSQWFLNIDHEDLRKKLVKSCDKVNWIPETGYKRITSMIENRPDWCLSRQRFWGTPVPAFYCKECGELLLTDESIKAVEDLFRERGSDLWFVKEASEILPQGTKCEKCGSTTFQKETDILDVWFDSGASHEAVLKRGENKNYWPADVYLEGSDQHRGWFQASLILAVALYGEAPYKGVVTHGFTVDGEGKKMSKSLGNGVAPGDIINKYGADVLRLWIASENYREDMRISDEIIGHMIDAYRKIRNTARYILGNLDGFEKSKDEVPYHQMLEIDKWALLKLSQLSKILLDAYEQREFHIAYRQFYNFCIVELSSIYFDILKDRLYVLAPKSLERRSAQTALYYLGSFLSRFIAPIMPFTAEEIWKHMPFESDVESILLQNIPGKENKEKELLKLWAQDEKLGEKWNNIFEFRKVLLKKIEDKRLEGVIGNSLEARVNIKVNKEIKDLEFYEGISTFWAQIAIVSKVDIKIGDTDSNNLVSKDFLPEILKDCKISVSAEKAAGKKCDRCWNWTEEIGEFSEYPDFCERCAQILKSL
ncbi:isoleucine--tRNA ligase [bacterium]